MPRAPEPTRGIGAILTDSKSCEPRLPEALSVASTTRYMQWSHGNDYVDHDYLDNDYLGDNYTWLAGGGERG